MRLAAALLAFCCFGCASMGGGRSPWVAVSPCMPDDATPGTLVVRVLDAVGQPMSGAIVQARVRQRMPIAVGVADAAGQAQLSVTPPSATYELTASLPGFYPTCVEDVRAAPGCTTELRLPVRLAAR